MTTQRASVLYSTDLLCLNIGRSPVKKGQKNLKEDCVMDHITTNPTTTLSGY